MEIDGKKSASKLPPITPIGGETLQLAPALVDLQILILAD